MDDADEVRSHNRGLWPPPRHVLYGEERPWTRMKSLAVALLVAFVAVSALLVWSVFNVGPGGAVHYAPISVGWNVAGEAHNRAGTVYWYNSSVQSVSPSDLPWSQIASITVKGSDGKSFTGTVSSVVVLPSGGGSMSYSNGSWAYGSPATSGTSIHDGDLFVLELVTPDPGGSVTFTPSSSYTGSSSLMLP